MRETASARRQALRTWPQSWIQRENWEFETHSGWDKPALKC